MANVKVITRNGEVEGTKIRYINYENNNYFIYSLNEQDNEGYEKLYINKITSNEEETIDDEEWNMLKKVIPTIVKEIKSNYITIFKDLDIQEIEEINSIYAHTFRLKIDIVKLITKKTESEKINMLDEELEKLINSEQKEENNSLSKLDEFLQNPMDNIDDIEPPKQPIDNNSSKNIEELEKEIETYKERIKNLEEEVEIYKGKIEKVKTMLEA
ncbi:MAG: hypothetical protein J6K21_05475 [Bacilli bacterium]|nr:hypothetical protein [Bacilli bacterium]